MRTLSQKAYWEQFNPSPDFVILFLPGENFFSAALEEDPSLIEYGVRERVILATPTTLIALLRAVSYGWQQEQMTKHVDEIKKLGQTLHKRLFDVFGHINNLGKNLKSSVSAYNQMIGSFEKRVVPCARKFESLQVDQYAKDQLPGLNDLDDGQNLVRNLNIPITSDSEDPKDQSADAPHLTLQKDVAQ
jgi:DNA recombination protein RmuC